MHVEGNADCSMRHCECWSVATGREDSNADSQGRAVLGKKKFSPAPKIPQTKYIIWKTADASRPVKNKGSAFLAGTKYVAD